MSDVPKGTARGPRTDWGAWRANRDKRIANPRRLKTVKDSTNAHKSKGPSSSGPATKR